MDLEGAFRARHLLQGRETSSELTLWLQVAVFTHFIKEKRGDVTTATSPFRDTPRKREECRVVASAHFEPLFTSLRGRVYHSLDSARRDVAWPGSLTRCVAKRLQFVGVERDSRCIGFAIFSSLSPFQQMCHLIPWLTLATNCI